MSLQEIDLLEKADPVVRASWQQSQIENLLRHAASRSPFWKERLAAAGGFAKLPPQSRAIVRQEFAKGSLVGPKDGVRFFKGKSSGSSGSPVEYYETETNRAFGLLRTFLQLVRANVRLESNFTEFRNVTDKLNNGFAIADSGFAAAALSEVMDLGAYRRVMVNSQFDEDMLLEALLAKPCGIFSCPPRISRLVARLVARDDPRLAKLGIAYYVPRGDRVDTDLRAALSKLGIVTISNYSATEVGPIADECPVETSCYHIASSNVVLENGATDADGLRPLLVTHLHSYATPFVRYDIGDAGELADSCPHCGHNGPVITRLLGRRGGLLRLADGTMKPFEISFAMLRQVVSDLQDFRVTQSALGQFIVELDAGRELPSAEISALREFFRTHMAPGDYVITSGAINWGNSNKRHLFRSDI